MQYLDITSNFWKFHLDIFNVAVSNKINDTNKTTIIAIDINNDKIIVFMEISIMNSNNF